jgi:hypothetical protein
LHCRAHALLLTIAKVNIVTTSLKVTLRKLVMTQVFCGTRHATITDRWRQRDRTATFCRHANTWLIIAKTDHQNWLPIIPELGIIRNYWENWDPNNSQFFATGQSLTIIPNFPREACQKMESHLVESCSIFEVFLRKCQIPDILQSVPQAGLRGWPRLFPLGHEPVMEQPKGTQEHST